MAEEKRGIGWIGITLALLAIVLVVLLMMVIGVIR